MSEVHEGLVFAVIREGIIRHFDLELNVQSVKNPVRRRFLGTLLREGILMKQTCADSLRTRVVVVRAILKAEKLASRTDIAVIEGLDLGRPVINS